MKRILFCFLFLFFVGGVSALTTVLPSCEYSTVQSAIANANNGDIIILPAGSCTWSSTMNFNKGITLIGAGIDNTILINNVPQDSDPYDGDLMFSITSTSPWRLSNFTIDGNNKNDGAGNLQVRGSTSWWEIDNVKFIDSGGRHMSVQTKSPGIIHNCYFQDSAGQAIIFKANYGEPDIIWDTPTQIGDSDAIFIEDNVFYNPTVPRTAFDSEWGVKIVFRYNDLTNSYWLNHGCENGRSAVWIEAYENDVLLTVSNSQPVQTRRGGTGVAFNNVVSLQGTGRSSWQVFVLNDYCSKGGGLYYTSGSMVPKIGDILIGAVSGDTATVIRENVPSSGSWAEGDAYGTISVNTVSGNFNIGETVNLQRGEQTFADVMTTRDSGYASGALNYNCCEWYKYGDDCTEYPCLDQVGRTYDQILEPLYHWNNYYNGSLKGSYVFTQGDTTSDGIFGCADAIQNVPHDGEIMADYYDGILGPQTSKGVPFTGASGVGWGIKSYIPDSCTPGVGYWASDEFDWNSRSSGNDGDFYQCSVGRNWELHYTPYTYPHPLRSDINGTPEPPQEDYHKADLDRDYKINITEVELFIGTWKNMDASLGEVLDVIRIWGNGECYSEEKCGASATMFAQSFDLIEKDVEENLEELPIVSNEEVLADEILWLKLDGDFVDSSKMGNDVKCIGDCPVYNGEGSYYFDGNNDSLVVNGVNLYDLCSDGCTFSSRIYPFNNVSYMGGTIIAHRNYGDDLFHFYYTPGGKYYFKLGNDTSQHGCMVSGSGLGYESWNRVTAIYNTTHAILYLNDMEKNATKCNFANLDFSSWNKDEIYIGVRHSDLLYDMNGSIDDVKIFNYALSSEKIEEL